MALLCPPPCPNVHSQALSTPLSPTLVTQGKVAAGSLQPTFSIFPAGLKRHSLVIVKNVDRVVGLQEKLDLDGKWEEASARSPGGAEALGFAPEALLAGCVLSPSPLFVFLLLLGLSVHWPGVTERLSWGHRVQGHPGCPQAHCDGG